MIVRQIDPNGDYQLGQFLANSPEAVAQVIQTRLALWEGEWFLDVTDGTPYMKDILGNNTNYDYEIQERILLTPGVQDLAQYASSVVDRALTVVCTVDTQYGSTTFGATL